MAATIDEEIQALDFKLSQLRRDYDQYFLGVRPREPALLRAEVNKAIVKLTNTAILNTAARFKFGSVCSRFQAFRRQWDETLRKIEAGTYERHRFKAKLHAHPAGSETPETKPADDLYQRYIDARLACGENVKGLTRDKLDQVIQKQREQLRAKYGERVDFTFHVAVENGKVRLKAVRKTAAR